MGLLPVMSSNKCDSNTPVLAEAEISDRLARLPGWSHVGKSIEKTYRFKNFLRAMSFVNAVGYAAEALNHHPDLIIHYNEVTVRNWSHAAGGITVHDFALAERIDGLVRLSETEKQAGSN